MLTVEGALGMEGEEEEAPKIIIVMVVVQFLLVEGELGAQEL
jgi:hypothetical protein